MTDSEIRALARAQWASDDLEIDDDAVVSRGDPPHEGRGAFVAAWVWVDFDLSPRWQDTTQVGRDD